MKTKTAILSIAIIATLPFMANAEQTVVETNTPVAVGANGTVKQAADNGPYQTATIGEHDDEHIATTAYVKGAYNDAIAAVNKVNDSKQQILESSRGDPVYPNMDSIGDLLAELEDVEYAMDSDQDSRLISSSAVALGILSQRVEVYTTWDTNNTTDVRLKTDPNYTEY